MAMQQQQQMQHSGSFVMQQVDAETGVTTVQAFTMVPTSSAESMSSAVSGARSPEANRTGSGSRLGAIREGSSGSGAVPPTVEVPPLKRDDTVGSISGLTRVNSASDLYGGVSPVNDGSGFVTVTSPAMVASPGPVYAMQAPDGSIIPVQTMMMVPVAQSVHSSGSVHSMHSNMPSMHSMPGAVDDGPAVAYVPVSQPMMMGYPPMMMAQAPVAE